MILIQATSHSWAQAYLAMCELGRSHKDPVQIEKFTRINKLLCRWVQDWNGNARGKVPVKFHKNAEILMRCELGFEPRTLCLRGDRLNHLQIISGCRNRHLTFNCRSSKNTYFYIIYNLGNFVVAQYCVSHSNIHTVMIVSFMETAYCS